MNRHVYSKIVIVSIIAILTLTSLSPAQKMFEQKKAIDLENDFEIEYKVAFSPDDLIFGELMGYDTVKIIDGSYINDVDKPMMPSKNMMIALPDGMKATNIRILNVQKQQISGNYNIFPTQPPQKVGTSIKDIDFTKPDVLTYISTEPYPSKTVELSHQTDLAGQSMVGVTIYPLHYVPIQKRLTLITSIEFVIEGVDGYVCGDYLPAGISTSGQETYKNMVTGMVDNPKDVELHVADNPPQPIGVGSGDYDYVIITQSSWVDYFQPLADWKTKKGVPANIVTTTWIYNSGGYSGTDVDKIQQFVEDAHDTWGAMFFLLGGDTNIIPYHTRTISSVDPDPIPNDTYYADYDEDWTIEVHVGRAAVRYTSQISTFISKIMTYEKNPPASNYAKTAFFCGFDLDSTTESEQLKIYIKNNYLPADWTYRWEYDSESGFHKSDVIAYLNQGNNLANHMDHSNQYFMGTGTENHGEGLINSDMSSLSNGDRQTILYSAGCDPCAYDYTTCIAEAFVQNTGGGGIAFIGNSRYGWYYEGYDSDYLSMRYDRYFFRSLFNQYHYFLGECFSDHKNDAYLTGYGGTDIHQYIFTELTLLGDPELPIWTENPDDTLTSTYDSTIGIGSQSFNVQVQDSGGNVYGATVCLWKEDEVYEVGSTNSGGWAYFTINPTTIGDMYVTVTKHNYLPYEGTTTVVEGNDPPNSPTNVYPGDGTTDISIDTALIWNGGDPNTGDTVTYDVYFEADDSNPDYYDTTPEYGYWETPIVYDLPTLAYNTHYYWKIIAEDNHGETVTSNIWDFTTESEPTYTLTTYAVGSGSVEKNPDLPSYTYGQIVELTATPVPGYWHFDHWEGDVDDIYANPTTITMYEDEIVTAYFEPDELTLTIDIIGEGTVIKDPDQATYHVDDIVELTANPLDGWEFSEWGGDHSGSDNPTTITIDGNMLITATFNPTGYILNLADFPWYAADSPYNQMSGPAAAQMNLNYMWWNISQDPTPPEYYDDQMWLYNYGHPYNDNTDLSCLDAGGMLYTIQNLDPPYADYGYNFAIRHDTDSDELLKQICKWIDYPAGTNPDHPLHVPGAVPTGGNYEHWMSVRGIHTDQAAYPLPPSLSVYGFWVNDPYPSGIGANSYKTGIEWTNTYYLPISDTEDPYYNEYVAIVEPPAGGDCELTLIEATEYWNLQQPVIKGGSLFLPQVSDKTVIYAAEQGVQEQLIPYDADFAEIYERTKPGKPIYIKNLVEDKNDYYAVPFNTFLSLQNPKIPRFNPLNNDNTLIVVLVDAMNGQFKEASWVNAPVDFLPIKRSDALEVVFEWLIDHDINPDELNIRDIKTNLVYRGSMPYYPDWKVTINEIGMEFFVSQEGLLS